MVGVVLPAGRVDPGTIVIGNLLQVVGPGLAGQTLVLDQPTLLDSLVLLD